MSSIPRPDQATGISLAPSRRLPVRTVVRLAQRAEILGYDSIWIPETWGFDAVSVLAALAVQTERIRLASGVLNLSSRSATLIAQTAATLQDLSQNRFTLGLGVSGPRVVEGWHGSTFSRPLERTRAAVEIIRLALTGQTVDYHQSGYHLSGFSLATPPSAPIPLFLAAIGPRNVRLAGEIADGWLPIFAAPGKMNALFGELNAGMQAAGREASEIRVAAFMPCVLGPRGETLLRSQLAYYIGGMGSFYASYVRHLGFEDDVDSIRAAWSTGDRRSAVKGVPQRMIDACTLGTSEEEARSQMDRVRADGVQLPVLAFPHGAAEDDIERTLDALAPRA